MQVSVACCHHRSPRGLVSPQRFLFLVFVTQLYLTLQLYEVRSFTLAQILFLPLVPFISSATCGIRAAVREVLVFYPHAPFISLQQRHFTSAVLTRVTEITPSSGHNWKRSAHVNYASSPSLSLSLPRVIITLNTDGY